MTIMVSVDQFRARLLDYLDAVGRGQVVEITSHDRAIARIMAVDHQPASAHLPPEIVEAAEITHQHERVLGGGADREKLAQRKIGVADPQGRPGDLVGRSVKQLFGQQRRAVDEQRDGGTETEDETAHAMMSRRWKWCGPSLPP